MFDKSFIKTVKDQHTAIGKQIDQLTEHRTALATLLKAHGEAPAKPARKPATKAPAATTTAASVTPISAAPTSGSGHRKGYVTALLPFLFNKAEVSAAALYEHLKSLPGNAELKRNSLDATVQNELKKGANARIARVRPGVYAITEPGIEFLNAEDRGQAVEPQGEEAQVSGEIGQETPEPVAQRF